MSFNFSLKTTIVCGVLALGMSRAAVWQWHRHVEKQALIETLRATLNLEPIDLLTLHKSDPNLNNTTWRRVHFAGTYDFEHEIIVRRNRGSNDQAGFHVITPLQLDGSDKHVMIDRGFLPLGRHERDYRKRYQTPARFDGFGLIKESSTPKLFAPSDPQIEPKGSWADIWIRVNLSEIGQQLPYSILPVYLELMENKDDPLLAEKIVKQGSAGRNDVLALTGQKQAENFGMDSPEANYPIPQFDTTPPPDIHLGYVYEWGFMAILTIAIGIILQLKRPTRSRTTS